MEALVTLQVPDEGTNCWECAVPVTPQQYLDSHQLLRAVLCGRCESWALRLILKGQDLRAKAAK
jgi:hypothetical protein